MQLPLNMMDMTRLWKSRWAGAFGFARWPAKGIISLLVTTLRSVRNPFCVS